MPTATNKVCLEAVPTGRSFAAGVQQPEANPDSVDRVVSGLEAKSPESGAYAPQHGATSKRICQDCPAPAVEGLELCYGCAVYQYE